MRRSASHNDENTHPLLRGRRGDAVDFFGRAYRDHRRGVMNFLAKCGGHRALLEDLAQEVFLRAWEHRDNFRADSSLETYLFAIARNVLREHQRGRSKQNGTVLKYLSDDALSSGLYIPTNRSNADSGPQLSQALEEAKAKLSEAQREALELDRAYGMQRTEAVKLAGCSPGQFADRLYRVRKRLRQLLKRLPLHVLL